MREYPVVQLSERVSHHCVAELPEVDTTSPAKDNGTNSSSSLSSSSRPSNSASPSPLTSPKCAAIGLLPVPSCVPPNLGVTGCGTCVILGNGGLTGDTTIGTPSSSIGSRAFSFPFHFLPPGLPSPLTPEPHSASASVSTRPFALDKGGKCTGECSVILFPGDLFGDVLNAFLNPGRAI